jgi:hypothetical protein
MQIRTFSSIFLKQIDAPGSPIPKVVVLAPVAPIVVGIAVHCLKLLGCQRNNTAHPEGSDMKCG